MYIVNCLLLTTVRIKIPSQYALHLKTVQLHKPTNYKMQLCASSPNTNLMGV